MTICIDCKDTKHCSIANDLYIIAGIHGIQIAIIRCPIYKKGEEADERTLDAARMDAAIRKTQP